MAKEASLWALLKEHLPKEAHWQLDRDWETICFSSLRN